MSEGISLILLAVALIVTLVIVIWAALTLVTVEKSDRNKTLYLIFSATLPSMLLVMYAMRTYLYPSHLSGALAGFLLLCGWVGTLILCLCGIRFVLSARRHREPFVRLLVGAFLSGSIFLASCIVAFR